MDCVPTHVVKGESGEGNNNLKQVSHENVATQAWPNPKRQSNSKYVSKLVLEGEIIVNAKEIIAIRGLLEGFRVSSQPVQRSRLTATLFASESEDLYHFLPLVFIVLVSRPLFHFMVT